MDTRIYGPAVGASKTLVSDGALLRRDSGGMTPVDSADAIETIVCEHGKHDADCLCVPATLFLFDRTPNDISYSGRLCL